jgi:hypothetical protein
MSEATTDVQRDIALTRERMSETIAELDARISSRVAVIKDRLDLKQLVEDHPWTSLAVAVGLGLVLGGTGAESRAAQATVRAAKRVPGATADMARRGWESASSIVRRDDGQPAADEPPINAEDGLADRLRGAIARAIGVDVLVEQMRDAATQLARPASYAGQRVPQNTGQQM